MIDIPIENRNCHIFELVALGQIILRRTKSTRDKNELTKALYESWKEFNHIKGIEKLMHKIK